MRWQGQLVEPGSTQRPELPGMPALKGLVRSVRTPEFADVTFHEVRARSVLNRVPGTSPMPFSWTVNPYRGCSHACTYCLAADTPILRGDGRVVPLSEVRAGEAVYGTERRGRYRYYVRTRVRDVWTTRKPAWRVVLADGTTLLASAEHRFLTERGWKHVAAQGCAGTGRPHLTTADTLVGLGALAGGLGPGGLPLDLEGTALTDPVDLGVRSVEPLDRTIDMIDLSTGTGDFVANGVVSHNCFARNTHTYLDLDAGADFDRQVVVKLNAPEVLARELRSPRWAREHVAMGTNTDPYQRAEGRYRLMPGIVGALACSGTPLSILTKGTLLARDLPDLVAAARDVPVGIGVSLALLDPDLHRSVEPGTPTPRARLDLVRRITDAGLPCGVFVAPVLPGLTDSDEALDALLTEIAAAGATGASVLALHLRPGTREWFHGWLERTHPDLLERYAGLYRGGAYVETAYRRDLAARVRPLLRRHGLDAGGHRMSADEREGREGPGTWPAGASPPRPASADPTPDVPAAVVTAGPEQLSLL